MVEFNGKDLEFASQVIHTANLMAIQGSVRRPYDPVYIEAKKLSKEFDAQDMAIPMSQICARWLRRYLRGEEVLSAGGIFARLYRR